MGQHKEALNCGRDSGWPWNIILASLQQRNPSSSNTSRRNIIKGYYHWLGCPLGRCFPVKTTIEGAFLYMKNDGCNILVKEEHLSSVLTFSLERCSLDHVVQLLHMFGIFQASLHLVHGLL
jgi:hypothetical protein